jgi:hypothetical protein
VSLAHHGVLFLASPRELFSAVAGLLLDLDVSPPRAGSGLPQLDQALDHLQLPRAGLIPGSKGDGASQ